MKARGDRVRPDSRKAQETRLHFDATISPLQSIAAHRHQICTRYPTVCATNKPAYVTQAGSPMDIGGRSAGLALLLGGSLFVPTPRQDAIAAHAVNATDMPMQVSTRNPIALSLLMSVSPKYSKTLLLKK